MQFALYLNLLSSVDRINGNDIMNNSSKKRQINV